MKYIPNYILATICAGALSTACQQEEYTPSSNDNPKELLLSSESISDRIEANVRANGNTFFSDKYKLIKLFITPSGTGSKEVEKIYTYTNRIFKGNDDANKYYFQMNDAYISKLVAKWPSERGTGDDSAIGADGTVSIPTDQRSLDNYRKADWLTASVENSSNTIEGIMPTDAPVPLHFTRNNARLEFEIQGQNAYGQSITSLILELQLAGSNGTTKATAFWAYPNEETGHAEVILPGGSKLTTPRANYMIGRIAVAGKKNYTGTVIMPDQLNIDLKANTSYLVTLTPRGDNLIASITIGGFGQDEEGIGMPFQLPTPDPKGVYEINNAAQLMTLSYILREYKVGSTSTSESEFDQKVSAIEWHEQTYKLVSDIVISEDLIWKPVTKDSELSESNFDLNGFTITQKSETISFFKD